MAHSVALVGATSLVGEAVLDMLLSAEVPFEHLVALDDGVDEAAVASYGERNLRVQEISAERVAGAEVVLLAADQPLAPALCAILSAAQVRVLDLTGCWSAEYSATGVVDCAARGPGIYRQSQSVTNLLRPVLQPLLANYGIEQVHVTALLAVSEAGQGGVRELAAQTTSLLNARGADPKRFGNKQLAFNIFPGYAGLQNNQPLQLEQQSQAELQAFVGLEKAAISVRALLTPVFFGHGLQVVLQTANPVTVEAVQALWAEQAGLVLLDEAEEGWPTSVTESAGQDDLFVGRVSGVSGSDRHLNFWIVSDNVRRGVAYDAVQQTLTLIKHLL
ncbi:Asd/ArgC dimerization domain-containing protein [Atopomonas hussainii]|uniref:Asd/ArgC dimerization domain-containing protein n=1 Tax=Atopomonas hussainii TaxID=1429083 RepID=UPI00090012DF|nr:Asd/ArgC dimerization domain-containing protein [Atopomonas hussainii]